MKHLSWIGPTLALLLYLWLTHAGVNVPPPRSAPGTPPQQTVPPAYPQDDPTAREPSRRHRESPDAYPNDTGANASAVPNKAYEVLRYVRAHHGEPPEGYEGGRVFEDRGRVLQPPTDHFREYDVDPHHGQRDAERLVIDTDTGQAYYTGDHYQTFTPVNDGP